MKIGAKKIEKVLNEKEKALKSLMNKSFACEAERLYRQKGSHAIYKNIQGKRVVVPIHSGKDIKQGTLMGMIQDIDVDKETFFKLLQE